MNKLIEITHNLQDKRDNNQKYTLVIIIKRKHTSSTKNILVVNTSEKKPTPKHIISQRRSRGVTGDGKALSWRVKVC